MVQIYEFQEGEVDKLESNIRNILEKINQLLAEGTQQLNGDMMKSTFMLIEAMYSISNDKVKLVIIENFGNNLYQSMGTVMNHLNADIMQLNNLLKED